jgi:hypothetical protein
VLALALARSGAARPWPPLTWRRARRPPAQVLQQLQPRLAHLLQGAPLRVQLRGLSAMNDDPAAAHVVYVQVGARGRWLRSAARLRA